ncbi:MAG: hypothetical protein ACI4S3_03535 [Candidatus Gastranaerophilaceae bacterium]
MARINSERVSDKLNYEEHIKGKRLIRLSAGVCSGKNYWVKKTAEENPDLRILFITSRKNTVIAQANKMKASTFIDLDQLSDDDLSINKNTVCTNASIEKFFKYKYKSDDPNTYLWNKFDLIVLDEAHALTTDATFTDNFYTERLIRHTFYRNDNCDIILMSGTQEPIDWLFKGENSLPAYNLDLFNECLHLMPKEIHLIDKETIKYYIYNLWKKGERLIYFANYKSSISELTNELIEMGIPEDDFGFSFNINEKEVSSEKASFPKAIEDSLRQRIDNMNEALTVEEKIPENIKIFFSTSKNKEGINILDDDIKTAFAETHNKSELIQIAGRVRGNSESGEGIEKLVIVSNAQQHIDKRDMFIQILNKSIVEQMNSSLSKYKEVCKRQKIEYRIVDVLKQLPEDVFNYIRYDYVSEEFVLYQGRIEGKRQNIYDCKIFSDIVKYPNVPCFTHWDADSYHMLTGLEFLENEWFKGSKVFILHFDENEYVEMAGKMLRKFLYKNNFLNVKITEDQRNKVKEEIHRISNIYGYKTLGIKKDFKSLKPILNKFDIDISPKGKNSEKPTFIIKDMRC